jgi:hypothetical protein
VSHHRVQKNHMRRVAQDIPNCPVTSRRENGPSRPSLSKTCSTTSIGRPSPRGGAQTSTVASYGLGHTQRTPVNRRRSAAQKRRGLHTTFDTEAPRAAGATHTRQHKSADQRAVAVSTSLESKQTSSVTHTPTLRAEKEGGGHRKAAIEETRRAPSERSETRTAFLIHRGC